MMRLHRHSPPPQSCSEIFIGLGAGGSSVHITTDPRALIGGGLDFFPAFAKACAVLWGEKWHGPLETVCGLRKGTAKKWMTSHTIPPPMIVGWVAYLASKPNARATGHALLAIAEGADMDLINDAWDAFKGMNDGQ